MKITPLKLAKIVTTAGTQIRARIDTDTVDQYAEAMRETSAQFPPVVVFHDGSEYILADGFHRVMAASRNGFLDIKAEIHKGTKADALKFALGANSSHGLRRTNADKRRSVELALAEWPDLSDREIAKICGVGHPFVGDVRGQLVSDSSCDAPPTTRIGADGKRRKVPVRHEQVEEEIAEPAPVAPEPEPEPEQPTQDDPAKRQALNEIETTQYSLSILKTAIQNGTGDKDGFIATAMRLRKAANALEQFAQGIN